MSVDPAILRGAYGKPVSRGGCGLADHNYQLPL
jgi:hypothetical protein